MTLLMQYEEKLDNISLNKCLRAATRNNSATCISHLVAKGASDLDACLDLAQRERKIHSCAMLLLIKAAYSGNSGIIKKLFNESADNGEMRILDQHCVADILPDIQKVMQSGAILTTIPIDIALKHGNDHVREQLLMKTNVNKNDGCVNWCNLHLHQLQLKWLQEISWVQTLLLAGNGFDRLPDDISHYLKQVGYIYNTQYMDQ